MLQVVKQEAGHGLGECLPFEKVCQCFEALKMPTADRHKKVALMTKLWTAFGKGKHDIYPLMRLTLPQLDTERPNYKVKHKNLSRMYVDMLALPETSEDARSLLEWKKPQAGFQRNEQGNFPEVVYSVIKDRCTITRGSITVGEINKLLDALAAAESIEAKRILLTELHTRCTAQEQRWLLRIILKDMQIGMKEDSIFNMLHADAKEHYNSVCDLHNTCQKCSDPTYRLDSIDVVPFQPFKPRLAQRADNWKIIHKFLGKKGEYVAEYKLDGERVVCHFERGAGDGGSSKAQWWTRNCHDFTKNYGEPMAPILAECFPPELQSCMLDGEMMVWNQEKGDYAAFGENRGLSDYQRRITAGYQPCYVVFDILWHNGRSLAQNTLRERRDLLQSLLRWKPHSLELSEVWVVQPNPQGSPPSDTHTLEIMLWLDRAMERGYEGIMFKSLASTYAPGARDGDWMKLKPDYVHDMGDELDLLILAGYYGEGTRRSGEVSHFLLGLRAPDFERRKLPGMHAGDTPLFYPFCKVGSGYTLPTLNSLRMELKQAEQRWHKTARPNHLCGWEPNKTDDEPDVWYEPTLSKVMSIAAYEMVASEAFRPANLTLRFPRCAKIRDDKGWEGCETFEAAERRLKDGKAKVAASKRSAADVARMSEADLEFGGRGGKRGKQTTGATTQRKVGLLAHSVHDLNALAKVECEYDVLKGKVVVVKGAGGLVETVEELREARRAALALPGAERRPKPCLRLDAIKRLMKTLGAEAVHANITAETSLVVDADQGVGVQVKNLIARAEQQQLTAYDIVSAEWLWQCHEAMHEGKSLPLLEPRFALYATHETRSEMAREMDEWGDRYKVDATAESLRAATALVRRSVMAHPRLQCYGGGESSGFGNMVPYADGGGGGGGGAMVTYAGSSGSKVIAAPAVIDPMQVKKIALQYLNDLPDADHAAVRDDISGTRMLMGVVAYAPRAPTRLRLRMRGAVVVSEPTAPGVTHAVLPASAVADGSCAQVRTTITRTRAAAMTDDPGVYAWLVCEEWLDACEKQGSRAEERQFAMREGR